MNAFLSTSNVTGSSVEVRLSTSVVMRSPRASAPGWRRRRTHGQSPRVLRAAPASGASRALLAVHADVEPLVDLSPPPGRDERRRVDLIDHRRAGLYRARGQSRAEDARMHD